MEAWDIIVVGDGPAALYAAAEAAKGGASTLMMSSSALGNPGLASLEGLSASVQEMNNRSHREDTIRHGAFLCDQDIVAETTAGAIKHVDLLERRGLNFRRDQQGLPMVRKAPGHAQPRTTDAGSATTTALQQIAEEQCMRHGVIRRGDQIPLSLVHTNQSVDGLIALDMINGVCSLAGFPLPTTLAPLSTGRSSNVIWPPDVQSANRIGVRLPQQKDPPQNLVGESAAYSRRATEATQHN